MKRSRIFLGLSIVALAFTAVCATKAGTISYTYDVYLNNIGCTQSITDCDDSSIFDCPTTTIGAYKATFYYSTNVTCIRRLKKNF